MKHSQYIRTSLARFASEESGAVTVDWVVLTAAVVGLVTAIFVTLGNDTVDYSSEIGDYMSTLGIKSY